MTHLHLPDGVLPFWLWAGGFAFAAALIALGARVASGTDFRRRLPVLSMTAALMIVAMSIPVIPAIYHVQLAGLAGIILGPGLGLIAVFIVNLLLALVGHGGITVVGLNTLILSSEMFATWALYKLFKRALAPGAAAGAAAFLAMAVGAGVMLTVIALASPQVGLAHLREVTSFGEHRHQVHAGSLYAALPYESLSVRRFAILVVGLGSIGWVLEGVVTGLMVRFAARVKPDLVGAEAGT
jgi:cobalt/nickel transport system permease protein